MTNGHPILRAKNIHRHFRMGDSTVHVLKGCDIALKAGEFVAIFLIFCIFYMIVVEKTKDIGIIKSVGATSGGVAGIFLGYGAAIGIVGAGLGLLMGWSIVHNINTLHDWLGKAMNVVIWDPEIYAFDTIPNTMSAVHVARILGAAIIASILGALVPAIRAARMHPVEALRWE